MVLVVSSGKNRAKTAGPRPVREAPPVRADFQARWWRPFTEPRITIMVGLILAYVWRWHDLTPGVSFLRIAAVLTVLSWAYLVLEPRLAHVTAALRLPFVVCFLLILLWAMVGAPFALDPGKTWTEIFDNQSKNLTFMLFIIASANTFARFRLALAANVAGAAAIAFYYIKGGTPTEWTPVPMYDRNDLALLFNMFLPISLYFGMVQKSTRARIPFFILAVALAFSVLMSQSRGGFLGLCVMFLFVAFTQKEIPLRVRLAPIFILAVALPFLPAPVKDRLRTLQTIEQDYNFESPTGRIEIWKRGLGYIQDRPLFGVGLLNFPLAEETLPDARLQFAAGWRGSVAHNSYLEITAETGVLGGLLYVSLLVTAFVSLWRLKGRFRRVAHQPAAREMMLLIDALRASILAYACGAIFLSTFFLSSLVLLLSLVGGCCLVSRPILRRLATSTTPVSYLSLG